jgi:site-specific recombinase XerD
VLRKAITYFYLLKQSGCHTIYCRVSVNGENKVRSTGQKIKPEDWNQETQRSAHKGINETLSIIEHQIRSAENELITTQQPITLKNILGSIDTDYKRETFLDVFHNHNKKLKELVGVGEFAKGTYTKYNTMLKHTINFLADEYDKDDIDFSELSLEWIENFEHWFRTKANISHNTTLKYLTCIKKIVNIGHRKGYIHNDPFEGFSRKKKETIPTYLNIEELKRIENKDFEIERLQRVADCFIFGCYTGLAYSDMANLDRDKNFWREGNNIYLQTRRTKTKEPVKLILFPTAKRIYKKYENNSKVLPINSNQRMNAYLKEIQTLCRIPKELTTHVARHTFATTICISNGVSIETLQILLGHSDRRSTTHYGKVTNTKIMKDMKELKNRLG